MIASRLAAISGVSATLAKGILVLGLGAISAAIVALVQDGYIGGALASIAPIFAGLLTGIAALVDPNAEHA